MKCDQQLIADDKLRIVLENNICRDDGPQPNCFCIPMAYAWTALSEVILLLFQKNSLFIFYNNTLSFYIKIFLYLMDLTMIQQILMKILFQNVIKHL